MKRRGFPDALMTRPVMVAQRSALDTARQDAVMRAGELVYQRRDVVGPGRESWQRAVRERTTEAGIALAVAACVVTVYEEGLE